MDLSDTERKILLKMYDECYLSYNDEISTTLLYDVSNKLYLWKVIKQMECKGIITSQKDGRKKYLKFSNSGKRIVKALVTIREIKK